MAKKKKCVYINPKTGEVDNLYTALYGYLDDTSVKSSEKVYQILKDFGIITKYNGTYYLKIGKKGVDLDNNKREISKINSKYPKLIRLVEIQTKGERNFSNPTNVAYGVVINQQILDSIQPQPSIDYTEDKELQARIQELKETDRFDIAPIDSRITNKSLETSYTQKKNTLIEIFKSNGVEVQVIENNNLGTIGTAYKKGGNWIVEINPTKLQEDTLIHEFGHIFVEMLGYDNSVVQRGIKQLKTTSLWQTIQDNYSDYTLKQQEIELLVTAIGLEGSELFNSAEKTKGWKIWLNRFYTFINELFGINTARKLANDMLNNPFDSATYTSNLESFRWEQRPSNKVSKLIEDAKVHAYTQIKAYQARLKEPDINAPESEWNAYRSKLVAISELQKLYEVLQVGDELESITTLIDNIYKATEISKAHLIKLKGIVDKPGFSSIQRVVDLYEYVNSYQTLLEELSTILVEEESSGLDPVIFTGTNIKEQLLYSISSSKYIKKEYEAIGIPLMADFLLKYSSDDINHAVKARIDNIKEFNRGVFFKDIVRRTKAFKELDKDYKNKKISEEEYRNLLTEMVINKIKNDNMITRETLIQQLTASSRDKSGFSRYFDPLIYSNDKAVALFAKAVKEQLYKATIDTRNTAFEIKNYYDKYQQVKGGGDNVAKFNEDIQEEVEVAYQDDDGKWSKRLELSFVQPYLVSDYARDKKQAYIDATNRAKKELNIEELPNRYDKEYEEFLETDIGKNFKNLRGKYFSIWMQKNTEVLPEAEELLKKQLASKEALLSDLSIAEKMPDSNNKQSIIKAGIAEIDAWIRENTINLGYGNTAYKGTLVRPSEKYKNPKFFSMYKETSTNEYIPTNASGEYHKELLEAYKKEQRKLPKSRIRSNSWDNFTYLAPSVRKKDLDALIEYNIFNGTKELLHDAFVVRNTDTQYGVLTTEGEELKTVPIFYTQGEDVQYVSKDMATSILLFAKMANEYKYKVEIQGEVNLMMDLIANRTVEKTNSKGETIMNALSAKIGIQRVIPKNETSQEFQHLQEFVDMVYYGKKEIKQEIWGIDLNKVSRKLIGFTAINALAGNFLQGANNIILGKVLDFAEAVGGEFYNTKDWGWAQAEYIKELPNILSDVGKPAASSEIGQIIELIDPLQGEFANSLGHNVSGHLAKKLFRTDAFFMIQHGGEHQLQVATMLAMMKNFIVKDSKGNGILNDKGEPMNLREAFKKDSEGRVKLDDRVANFNINNFRNRLHGINGKLHGKYNEFDKAVLKRRFWGNLVMLFRSWLVPGLRRRFGHGETLHTDIELSTISEGTYISFGRFLISSIREKQNQWDSLSNTEKANVRKTLVELVAILSAFIVVRALSSLDLDGDDDELYFLMYQARRLQAELMFYTPIVGTGEAWRIVKSPTATITVIDKTIKLGAQLFNPTEVYERDTGFSKKGDLKLAARIRALMPVIGNIEKSLKPEDSYQYMARTVK